jgi:hypothetical protein
MVLPNKSQKRKVKLTDYRLKLPPMCRITQEIGLNMDMKMKKESRKY